MQMHIIDIIISNKLNEIIPLFPNNRKYYIQVDSAQCRYSNVT